MLVFACECNAQVETLQNYVFEGDTFNIFVLQYKVDDIAKFDLLENRTKQKHQVIVSQNQKEKTFLINSGVNDINGIPKGYFKKNFKEIKPVDLGTGNTNFYMKPNGGILFTPTDIIICESSEIKQYNDVRLGVQSGTMLINKNQINQNFNSASTNKQLRCGVGTYIKNDIKCIVFIISKNAITFYRLAQLFQEKYKSENALLLESSGCAMYFPGLQNNFNDVIGNYFVWKF
jgi:uncharacterized protein YigE (DUF2233 family)